jgi:hypothetical protein
MNEFLNNIQEKLSEFTGKITSRRSDGSNDSASCPDGTGSTSSTRGTKTRTIESTYHATDNEFYIGVVSEKPVTVYLPEDPTDGKLIIVKAEMNPPLGNRKITIATMDGSKIDGYSESIITVSHGCSRFIFNNNGWHVI